ncbi:hypothetical protein JCM6882_008346 [Rhodosporidiobolus microsporus]
MPANDYKLASKGGLKLKGSSGGAVDPTKKKKKKSSSSKKAREGDESAGAASGSGREESPVTGGSSSSRVADGKTDAQRRFEEVQRKRLLDKAAKAAVKSHKDRVAEFNEKLENLSEHYDIPKVGPG